MNNEPDHSPLFEEKEVVDFLQISSKELEAARKQRVLRAEPFKQRWWQWQPRYRYRLRALWEFARDNEARVLLGGYKLPGERAFNNMVCSAIRLGASDVHVQQQPRITYVRFRINGLLNRGTQSDPESAKHLFPYLSLIAERDPRKQNVLLGSCILTEQAQEYWVRFSSVRAQYGMATTLRILPPAAPTEWAQLGMTDAAQEAEVSHLVESRELGLTLFAAPSGEGLTTTLRRALYQENRPENNILFADDVEDFPTGAITRVIYDRENGLTPSALVDIAKRQDATLLVFGVIADAETALAAIQAAESGMRVWAGVRVPDFLMNKLPEESAEILSLQFWRWGIGRDRLHRVLRGAVMQRLLRCLCPACRKAVPLTGMQELQIQSYGITAPEQVYQGVGCENCHYTGYASRTGVFSVYVTRPRSKRASSFTAELMRRFARGNTDLRELERLDAWGLEGHRNRIIANNELVQKL